MTQYVDNFKMSSGTYLFKDTEGRELIKQNKQEIDETVIRIDKNLMKPLHALIKNLKFL